MFIKQLSVFLENNPGTLRAMTELLGRGGIDLLALSIADTQSFGIVRTIINSSQMDEAVRLLGKHIVHVHLSDHGDLGDCLRIGKGRFQITQFLSALRAQGFDGAVTLELYREAFGSTAELAEDWQKTERLIRIAEKE